MARINFPRGTVGMGRPRPDATQVYVQSGPSPDGERDARAELREFAEENRRDRLVALEEAKIADELEAQRLEARMNRLRMEAEVQQLTEALQARGRGGVDGEGAVGGIMRALLETSQAQLAELRAELRDARAAQTESLRGQLETLQDMVATINRPTDNPVSKVEEVVTLYKALEALRPSTPAQPTGVDPVEWARATHAMKMEEIKLELARADTAAQREELQRRIQLEEAKAAGLLQAIAPAAQVLAQGLGGAALSRLTGNGQQEQPVAPPPPPEVPQQVTQCAICGLTFTIPVGTEFADCPRCRQRLRFGAPPPPEPPAEPPAEVVPLHPQADPVLPELV